jgi:hypothetical protein
MIKQMLKRAIICAVLCVLPLAGIRAQVHEHDGYEAFMGRRCDVPCWQGIMPNVTTREQALAILQAHPHVETIFDYSDPINICFDSCGRIIWNWDEQLRVQNGAVVNFGGTIELNGALTHVQRITLNTPFSLAELRLALGAPAEWQAHGVFNIYGVWGGVRAWLHYPSYSVDAVVTCPLTRAHLWAQSATLTLPKQVLNSAEITPRGDFRWVFAHFFGTRCP